MLPSLKSHAAGAIFAAAERRSDLPSFSSIVAQIVSMRRMSVQKILIIQ